jgi:hypothetical protein
MKVEDVVYSAVAEARLKKRVSKYGEIWNKIETLKPGEAFSVKVQAGEDFKNVQVGIRRIADVWKDRKIIDVDAVGVDGYIYVSMKPRDGQEPKKIKTKA